MEFVEVPKTITESKQLPTYLAKLGNVMNVQPTMFNPATFQPENPQEYTDEQGRTQIKGCDIENYIRWRSSEEGLSESNARLVRWEDGSYTMHIGTEAFEVNMTDQPFTYTSLRHRDMYFMHNKIQAKMLFTPCSIKNRMYIRKLENTLNPVKTIKVAHTLKSNNSKLQVQEMERIRMNQARKQSMKVQMQKAMDEAFLEDDESSFSD